MHTLVGFTSYCTSSLEFLRGALSASDPSILYERTAVGSVFYTQILAAKHTCQFDIRHQRGRAWANLDKLGNQISRQTENIPIAVGGRWPVEAAGLLRLREVCLDSIIPLFLLELHARGRAVVAESP